MVEVFGKSNLTKGATISIVKNSVLRGETETGEIAPKLFQSFMITHISIL